MSREIRGEDDNTKRRSQGNRCSVTMETSITMEVGCSVTMEMGVTVEVGCSLTTKMAVTIETGVV